MAMEHGEMVRELTVILDGDGKITAAQVRGADGVARGLVLGDLPASLAAVNEAALLSVAELSTARAQLDAYKARGLQAADAVLAALDKATADAIANDIKRDERERNRLAALAELAAAQAKVDRFG
jgi:hypothetical protein